MSRYIDADKLIEHLNAKSKTDYEMGLYNHGALTESFIRFVERQPTADVVEVRHGYWTGMNGDQCSHCGKSLRDLMDGDSYYSSEFEYRGFDALVACPFCGTKMDGERREG